jgi:hypothetical protein
MASGQWWAGLLLRTINQASLTKNIIEMAWSSVHLLRAGCQ